MKDILIATSISPYDVDQQLRSLKTWQVLGSNLVTLNHSSEIEAIKTAQAEFEVVEVQRSAKELVGKPLVFIDDFLEYFIQSPHTHLAIVNSDIHLRSPTELETAVKALEFDLFFGQRVDVTDILDVSGEFFNGFDYFIFSKDLAKKIPESQFCIGAPWWDHWIPLASIFLDAKVYVCDEAIAYHIIHEANYGVESLGLMGENLDKGLLDLLTSTSKKVEITSPGAVSMLRFCSFFSSYYQARRSIVAKTYQEFKDLSSAEKDMLTIEMARIMPVMTFNFIKTHATKINFQRQ